MFVFTENSSLPDDYSAVQSVEVGSFCAKSNGTQNSHMTKNELKEMELSDDDEKEFADDKNIDEEDEMIFTPSEVSFSDNSV